MFGFGWLRGGRHDCLSGRKERVPFVNSPWCRLILAEARGMVVL